jgi:hypothetical protein
MPLAATAIALVKAYRACTDETAKKVHLKLLDTLVRHAPGRVRVSAAAQAEAERLGLGDLSQYTFAALAKVMGRDDRRRTFAWDHIWTVLALRRAILELKDPTEGRVRRILGRASVAWILRTEAGRLNALGFRSIRPDPDIAYAQAGIGLLPLRWRVPAQAASRGRVRTKAPAALGTSARR